LALKLVVTIFSNLASKPVATVSLSLASKPVVVFLVEPLNQGAGEFSGLGLKTTTTFWRFGHQNHRGGFLGLGLKTKCAMVYQLRLKTDGGMRRCGTRVKI
jgi:hypothetical protein